MSLSKLAEGSSISVIIVGFHNQDEVQAFVNKLALMDLSLEVVVVVNDADLRTPHLNEPSRLRLRQIYSGRNLGFAAAFNIALHATTGEIVISMNVDTDPTPDLIAAASRIVSASPRPTLVGPTLFNERGIAPYRRFYSILGLLSARTAKEGWHLTRDPQGAHWVLGAFMATRRADLIDIGGLDERFFLYYEDVDLAWRYWANGGEVVVIPELHLFHAHGRASQSILSRPFLWHVLSMIRFAQKHPRSLIGHWPGRVRPMAREGAFSYE